MTFSDVVEMFPVRHKYGLWSSPVFVFGEPVLGVPHLAFVLRRKFALTCHKDPADGVHDVHLSVIIASLHQLIPRVLRRPLQELLLKVSRIQNVLADANT